MMLHDRKSIRLERYNYSTPASYFITFCTFKKLCFLGYIHNKEMMISDIGRVSEQAVSAIHALYENVVVDSYVTMPNHIHLIISILEPGGYNKPISPIEIAKAEPLVAAIEPTLITISDIIRNFKSYTANVFYKEQNGKLWQRGFYEHIIRNQNELMNTRQYIRDNPEKWLFDEFFEEPLYKSENQIEHL